MQLAHVGFARPQHPEKFFRKCSSRTWGLPPLIPKTAILRKLVAARARSVCRSQFLQYRKFYFRCSSRARGVCVRFCSFAVFDICSSRAWGLHIAWGNVSRSVLVAARARVGFARSGNFSLTGYRWRSKCPAKPLLCSWASWCALKAIFCRHINPLPHALSPFLGHSRASFFWPKASKTHFLRCSGFLSAKYSAIICSTASLRVIRSVQA